MPRSRLIDWKFLAMLTVMLLAAVACWGFVARQKQVNALIENGQRSTEQVRILTAKVDEQAAEADAARVNASAERDALLRQNRRLARQINAMAELLRENGLSVPELDPSADEPPPPKPQTPSGASPKPKPRTPSPRPTPTPPASPTPDDPGLLCDLAPLLCP